MNYHEVTLGNSTQGNCTTNCVNGRTLHYTHRARPTHTQIEPQGLGMEPVSSISLEQHLHHMTCSYRTEGYGCWPNVILTKIWPLLRFIVIIYCSDIMWCNAKLIFHGLVKDNLELISFKGGKVSRWLWSGGSWRGMWSKHRYSLPRWNTCWTMEASMKSAWSCLVCDRWAPWLQK